MTLLDPQTIGTPPGEVTLTLQGASPRTRVLLFSHALSSEAILGAVTAGAVGALPKSATPAELSTSVRAAADGQVVLDAATQLSLARHLNTRTAEIRLTPRELDVLRHAALGASANAIANALYLSTTTVKTHLRSAYRKLGATNKAGAVGAALRAGLLDEQIAAPPRPPAGRPTGSRRAA